MSPSEIQDGCGFGCTIEGKHFAHCPSYGVEGADVDCKGCAPHPVRDGVLVCDWCYRPTRGIVQNGPDLLGRMLTLTEQGKAVVFSPVKRSSSGAPARDQVDAELIDAIRAVRSHLRWWSSRVNLRTMHGFDRVLADRELLTDVRRTVLDRHEEDDSGARASWSLADAAGKWGAERRDRFVFPDAGPASVDRTLSRFSDREARPVIAAWPVREWSGAGLPSVAYDPLLVTKDAAERAGVTESQLRKWVAAGELKPDSQMRDARGVVMKWFYESKVLAVAAAMAAARSSGGRGKPRHRLAK